MGRQFAPAGTGGVGAATTAHLTSDQGLSIPWDIPLDEPLVRPFLTEIVPPPITGPIPRNPYPARPECVKEWNDAEEYCARLEKKASSGTILIVDMEPSSSVSVARFPRHAVATRLRRA